ncbi:hypothetical protein FHS43_000639 [Streptosporangium becharense]|uniref:DUF4440 domain-containing protein n=1 Tax=Streptosporangium becharense TaxID=1816182 RepID=A0A7W9IFP7_9ACTN|nr:DUF4440 domain-containing protein [Streptosporangium becharense]MBB2909393.1 hypothetical protein [Streptosporangium becharense]MBB5819650.1 hypothetical protein [Streptosporangium becharense]
MSAADEAACRAEIVRLHGVIERWLSGEAPRTPEEFAAFADAHGPGFTMVEPDGTVLDRERVLTTVESAYGTSPGLVIEIREVQLVAVGGPLLVATYRESHRAGGAARRSTVVLLRDPAAPGGFLLRHLHETWVSR